MKLNKTLILSIITVLLFFTYILSFNSHFTKTDSSVKIQTELVNEKNINRITKFQFRQGNASLYLIKTDDFWIIKTDEESKVAIPADTQKVEAFIKNLTQMRTIRKLSEKITDFNNYGFEDYTTIFLRYYLEDDAFSELTFGGQDFALSTRYLMVPSKALVYELDDSLDKYLDLSVQNWSEPTIISQNVAGKFDETDVQRITVSEKNKEQPVALLYNLSVNEYYTKVSKLLSLRHGGIGESIASDTPELVLKMELGNKKWITLNFFESTEENEFIVISQYYSELLGKKYSFTSKISLWTYNSIKEIIL